MVRSGEGVSAAVPENVRDVLAGSLLPRERVVFWASRDRMRRAKQASDIVMLCLAVIVLAAVPGFGNILTSWDEGRWISWLLVVASVAVVRIGSSLSPRNRRKPWGIAVTSTRIFRIHKGRVVGSYTPVAWDSAGRGLNRALTRCLSLRVADGKKPAATIRLSSTTIRLSCDDDALETALRQTFPRLADQPTGS